MTNILVTGGAGFIGSNFVRYMVDKYSDYHIINLDALTYCGNLENLKDIEDKDNYSFVKGDIRDKSVVDDLVKNVIMLLTLLLKVMLIEVSLTLRYSLNQMYWVHKFF